MTISNTNYSSLASKIIKLYEGLIPNYIKSHAAGTIDTKTDFYNNLLIALSENNELREALNSIPHIKKIISLF